jgi:hypothetical protein
MFQFGEKWMLANKPDPVSGAADSPARTAGKRARVVEPGGRPSKKPAASVEMISRLAGKRTRRGGLASSDGREKARVIEPITRRTERISRGSSAKAAGTE